VVRGATFDCGLLVVVAADVVDALLDVLLLLGVEPEPHPAKPRPKATMAIATPVVDAIRFICIAPVDQAAHLDEFVRAAWPGLGGLSVVIDANLRVCADVLQWVGPHAG
jgi:hypothetical protein